MPTSATEKHLWTQLDELQRRYDALAKRIAALDTDIGREMDLERKLTLRERRCDLAAERDQIATDMDRIECQLATLGAMPISGITPGPSQTAPTGDLSAQDRASLEYQLAEMRANLLLIKERKAEFVQETDIPLTLIKDERRLRQRIAEIEARVGRTRSLMSD